MTLNGFITNSIHATVKARLFSTNIRPILSYGLENCDLNIGNKDMVRRTEGNIVKKNAKFTKKRKHHSTF